MTLKKSDHWHTLDWFRRRRGKIIYRKPIKKEDGSICCNMCEETSVTIYRDKQHFRYLWDCQNDLEIRYFDSPV